MQNKQSAEGLMKIDGTLTKPDGTVKKTGFFDFLDIPSGDYSNIYFTESEAATVKRKLQYLSTGSSAAIPLICAGPSCIFAGTCPFLRIDEERKESGEPLITPVGRSCLIEVNLLTQWTRMYIQQFGVEEEDIVDFFYCRELAEIELMLWRINNNLAKQKNAEMVGDVVVGTDREGNVLSRLEISPFFEAKERLTARRARITKFMVGDRQEKYKAAAALHKTDDGDTSSAGARLATAIKTELRKLQLPAAPGVEVLTPDDIIHGKSG